MKKIFYTLLIVLFLVPVITHAETKKLYDVFKEEAESGSGLVREYTGEHKDSFTEEGTKKIYHWYAESNDNANTILEKWNVLFGGFCWQAYRTTDTGGVKLIYNGLPSEEYKTIPLSQNDYTIVTNTGFEWNNVTKSWNISITDTQNKEISFKIPDGEGYNMIQKGTSTSSSGGTYAFYKDGTSVASSTNGGGMLLDLSYEFGQLTSSNIIKMTFSGSASEENPVTFQIKIVKKEETLSLVCNSSGRNQYIGGSIFNSEYASPAHLGYKYGEVYPHNNSSGTGWKYAPDVIYSNGYYTLTSKGSYGIETKNDISNDNLNNYHYTCGGSSSSCSSVRYVYTVTNNKAYYITLSNGKKVEDALEDMLTNSSNTTDSTIKEYIDTWYQNNMIDYTDRLEDTIFCNDRSISNLGGWNPDGGSTTSMNFLKLRNYERSNRDLNCENVTDQFSISNTKASLSYPIGMLTSPEVLLLNNELLTNTGGYYWLLSPAELNGYSVAQGTATENGRVIISYHNGYEYGIRPVVSLIPVIKVVSGDGSKTNPYVVDWIYSDIEIVDSEIGYIEVPTIENIKERTEVVFHIIPVDDLIEIKIIDEEGNEIEYESTSNENEYKFIMPSSNVTISPVYKDSDIPILPDIVNPETGNKLFCALIIVMILELITYLLLQKKKERMKSLS